MLIISKFKDYYDHAMCFGIDKTIVYNRKTENVALIAPFARKLHTYRFTSIAYDFCILGVANKIYPHIRVSELLSDKTIGRTLGNFFNNNDLQEFLKQNKIKDPLTRTNFYNFNLDDINSDYSEFKKLFKLYNVPLFLVEPKNLVLNPNLKEIGFNKFMDATDCFQQIQSFIENNREKDIPQKISEKERIKQRGFDFKYGFRKRPKKGDK